MDKFYANMWKVLSQFVELNQTLVLGKNVSEFVNDCKKLSEEVKQRFMKTSESGTLDRHKLAAIVALCASRQDCIKTKEQINNSEVLLGRYVVALDAALSYLEDEINGILRKKNFIFSNDIIPLCIPEPTICETKLINSAARLLYWEEKYKVNEGIRVLELANTFFLIEEYTLIMNDIDIEEWTKAIRSGT